MYDPWRKRPQVYLPKTKTFPLATGGEITLTMRKLGQVEKTVAYELGEELIRKYIKGDEMTGEEAVLFPPVGGEVVQVTETILETAAMMSVMQPEDLKDRMNAIDFVALQIVEDEADVKRISNWVMSINKAERKDDPLRGDVPNGSGAGTPDSSEPASPDTDSTPSSPPAGTPSSAALTIVSGT